MELQTISKVSREYGISTRMLRYYEQIGLIESKRKEDYAYRVYDEKAINTLRQIIILRKLRVPVKQIISIFNNKSAVETLAIFTQNIAKLDEEITALKTVRSMLISFAKEIREKADVDLKLLEDDSVFSVINSLSFSENLIKKKEYLSMEDLNKSSEDLKKMSDNDVRIIYLPPMAIAAACAEGEETESKAFEMVKQFIADSGLLKVKPDARCFGFDCSPEPQGVGTPSKAYEVWVSIPDEMEVKAPLVKREFTGGLYAAHVLREWDFEDWRRLSEWVEASGKYANDWGNPRGGLTPVTGQGLEETLNFYHFSQNPKLITLQLDLLFPIKEK
ncbi:MAG: effector binding domain-containing protein [Lachnospiraceae bacterium]|nr:effector binding domain-containing protein [Lachnospiraceae bacterium]